jgi:AcrR family transcriptional regulator
VLSVTDDEDDGDTDEGIQQSREGAVWLEYTRGLRREQVVRAMAELASERGFERVSVAALCERAGVSRASFYALFGGREDCFLAALEQAYGLARARLLAGLEGVSDWRTGLRGAMAEMLLFLEAEPELARVCVVEALAAGGWALERREQYVAGFAGLVLAGLGTLVPSEPRPLTNTAMMAAALAIVQRHYAQNSEEPLIMLLGPLMAVAAAPYLDGAELAEEVERAEALARELLAGGELERRAPRQHGAGGASSELPAFLTHPRARRMRECLLCVSGQPGLSNGEVARAIGVASHAQISKLLARLQAAGLLVKCPGAPGYPNSWAPSAHGDGLGAALAEYSGGV